MSTTPTTKPGDVLAGKYRVERVLGSGGMGYVVAARHLQLDQMVAMKFLRKGAVENSEAAKRFLREAKAAVKLRNEHIAKVYDVGTLESGEPYIVMEHLDGLDLAALAKQRGTIMPNEAVEYVIQACEALAEAHSLGIIHRDIKLANLFVTRGPTGAPLVKVLDFGISKTNPFGESEHDMTRTSSMLGSPRFMSPEQMRDPRAVDGRSDIWSLGVVLYRLVGGKSPFEAETLGRLLSMVMHEPEAPLSTLRPDLPPGFEQVVGHCLQKDPAARFSSVAELAFALVPYAIDPVRARASAERIAATMSLPITGEISGPYGLSGSVPGQASRHSMPPGASDTGTAAPWTGTPGNRAKSSLTWLLGAALAALLVCTIVYAKVVRGKSSAAANANAAATTAMIAPPGSAPATATSVPIPTLLGASTPGPMTPSAPATGVTPDEPAPAVRHPTAGGARSRTPREPSTRTQTNNAARNENPAPAAPKSEDGIPSTRD